MALPAEVPLFWGNGVSPANAYCSGTGKRISRFRSVAWTVSSRRRISGRAMELVDGHESLLALSNRGALSILDASFKFARLALRRAMVNCANGTKSICRNPVFSAVIGVFAGLILHLYGCIGEEFRIHGSSRIARAGVGSWSSLRADKVQEKFQVHPRLVACAPFHGARCRL